MKRGPAPDFMREERIADMPRQPSRTGVLLSWIAFAIALGIVAWTLYQHL